MMTLWVHLIQYSNTIIHGTSLAPTSYAPTEPEPDLEIDPLFKAPTSETFEDKRRRLDQQETIWARQPMASQPASQPTAEASTAATSAATGEAELQARMTEVPLLHQAAIHAPPTPGSGSTSHKDKKTRVNEDEEIFHVDLKSATPDMDIKNLNRLAEGWTHEEKTNEFVLGPTQDFWSFEDSFLVQNHCWSRDHTFVLDESQLPFGLTKTDLQKTKGLTMINDHRKIYVNDEESYVVGNRQWHGKTLFPFTKEATTQRIMAYAGDLESKTKNRWILRGRGHVWAAVSVSKKRKEKDDLREGKMKLEDRLAFVEGKKAELSSIFENRRWNIILNGLIMAG